MAGYNDITTLQENICPDFDDEYMDEDYKPGKDRDDDTSDIEDRNGDDNEDEYADDYENTADNKDEDPEFDYVEDDENDEEAHDDDNIDNAVDSSGTSVSQIDVLKLLKEDTKVTTRSVDREEIARSLAIVMGRGKYG